MERRSMKPFHVTERPVAILLVFLTVCFLLLVANIAKVKAEEQAPMKADKAFANALQAADKSTVESLLDPKFTWTDAQGKMRTRTETLSDLSEFASDNAGYPDVHVNSYRQLALTYGVK